MSSDDVRLLLEPDRQFWRRRANRHVRKARLTRTVARWTLIAGANLAAAAVVMVAGVSAVRHLTTTPRFDVREIDVRGTAATTPARVREALAAHVGKNLLDLDLDRLAADATNDPWVRTASVKRVLPHTLIVSVQERTPWALALIHRTPHVVDDTGFVMGPVGPGFVFDLPVLTGLDAYAGRDLASALERGVAVLAELRRANPAWAAGISELDLSRPDRVAVTRSDGGPRVLLDPDRIDRNLDAWLRLRAELERRLGPAEYVDLRWSRRIAVSPIHHPLSNPSE